MKTAARRLAALVAGYVESGRAHMPHEEAVRDLLRERSQVFEVADVTGAPWIEIDFPIDVLRAAHEVLPQLVPLRRGWLSDAARFPGWLCAMLLAVSIRCGLAG